MRVEAIGTDDAQLFVLCLMKLSRNIFAFFETLPRRWFVPNARNNRIIPFDRLVICLVSVASNSFNFFSRSGVCTLRLSLVRFPVASFLVNFGYTAHVCCAYVNVWPFNGKS